MRSANMWILVKPYCQLEEAAMHLNSEKIWLVLKHPVQQLYYHWSFFSSSISFLLIAILPTFLQAFSYLTELPPFCVQLSAKKSGEIERAYVYAKEQDRVCLSEAASLLRCCSWGPNRQMASIWSVSCCKRGPEMATLLLGLHEEASLPDSWNFNLIKKLTFFPDCSTEVNVIIAHNVHPVFPCWQTANWCKCLSL